MADDDVETIKGLLARCTDDQRRRVFEHLRITTQIHELEAVFGAPAEVILEAIHRASDLTRWMLRGVVAEAAFAEYVVSSPSGKNWRDVTLGGNSAFDYLLEDEVGKVRVQVKLQRSSLKDGPIVTNGRRWGRLSAGRYLAELQRTRTGNRRGSNGEDEADKRNTRPYRFGDFDILAISLQPSSRDWSSFRYTVSDWLLPAVDLKEIRTFQPVAMEENDDWTDDYSKAVEWLRSGLKKRISGGDGVL